jgi:hypothetical protein
VSSRRKLKMAPNGRNLNGVEDRVIVLRRSLLHSPHFSALSVTARSLLFELQAMFNGTNNGTLFLSQRDAAARLGLSDLKAAKKAFDELFQLGFLTQTIGSSFHMKAGCISKACAWRLNWINDSGRCTGPDALPALDQTMLSKVQNRRIGIRMKILGRYLRKYSEGQFAVEESSTISARRAFAECLAVENSSTSGPRLPRRSTDSTQ